MHSSKRKFLPVLSAFLMTLAYIPAKPLYAQERIVNIGTAGVTGVYYPAGGSICRLVNRTRRDHGIRCMVESTSGSGYNLNALRQGKLSLGLAQSDWLYAAYKGADSFQSYGANPELKTLFSLHGEAFTVIARENSDLESFDQIKGRRVNIGSPGSGVRGTMEKLMQLKGWNLRDFKAALELKPSELGKALCNGRLDVAIIASGHPNNLMQNIASTCQVKLLPVEGEDVEHMVKESPYYTAMTIPGGLYPGNLEDIRTFGVKAVVTSTARLPDEVAYNITKAVFDNLNDFKTLHPVFSTLNPAAMATETVPAPIHPGAAKYFREKKLLPAPISASR